VASSDPTNLSSTITLDPLDKNYYIVNGVKWWTSGAMDPRCKLCVFMGKTPDPNSSVHNQHSMILIPMDTPGVHIKRFLSVFGYTDAPHGHAEVEFKNVRVKKENMLLGAGRGFEIAQGRLGPGRIHHCMRLIGMAERALSLLISRAQSRYAFSTPLIQKSNIIQDIANSRCEIEQARLLTLKAAYQMDKKGNKEARQLIAAIKIVAPNMAIRVIDRAIQVHGGAGVCQDYFLASAYSGARTLKIADGPDEVHQTTVAKIEISHHSRL